MLVVILGFTACDKDGDTIYLSGLTESKLTATQSKVVLSIEQSKDIVLSLAWTRDALITSDPNVAAPNITKQVMQIAPSADFSTNVHELNEASLSRAFTGAELNAVAKNIGLNPNEETPVYFRIAGTAGNNMDPVYSNVEVVNITSYFIDMSIGTVLNADGDETGKLLYSSESNGVYTGFMGVTSWYNYYLREGDGLIWGNDGVDGTPFLMSSDDSKFNYWFPGMTGCYFVEVNTPKKVWSALYIPSLQVTGSIEGEMTFDRQNDKWMYTFEAQSTGSITVNISGIGKQYDYATGTDDDAAISTPVAFYQSGNEIVYGQAGGSISVNVPQTGEVMLVLDLSDSRNIIAKVTAAEVLPEPIPTIIYLSGIDDLLHGWTFDNQLRLYHEDNQTYAGVAYSASEWGYSIYKEAYDWNNKFTYVSGDAAAGTMELNGEGGNIPAPAQGLYLFDVSLKALTYQTTQLEDVIYYSGLNDNWDSFSALEATDVTGVFAGSITITKASAWGFKLYLFNGDWNTSFGGSEGVLYYKGNDGITDDQKLTPGTYTLTVDLVKGTYAITQ